MFAPIDPFRTGHLDVGDGHSIYWEASGNPDGVPVLALHGGPGGGMGAGYRRRADPRTSLIVGFEQRGCGRSTPLAHRSLDALATNTTQHLIADIEALREHLGIERWLVTGLSWGSTLALAYAQQHPDRVSGIVLFAVTTGARAEVEWITETMGRIFPEAWDEFRTASGAEAGERTVDAYNRLLRNPDETVRIAAARAWMAWEDTHVSLDPASCAPGDEDLEFARAFATLVVHYWANDCFLPDDAVLRGMPRLAGIPGVLIHGRRDVSGPVITPWTVHRAWPGSELIVIDDEGHGGPRMVAAMVDAIARLSR